MKVTKKLLNELFKKYSDVVFKQHYGTAIPNYNDKIEISIVLIHAMVDEYRQYTGFEYDEEKELNMKNDAIIYVLDNVFKIKTI